MSFLDTYKLPVNPFAPSQGRGGRPIARRPISDPVLPPSPTYLEPAQAPQERPVSPEALGQLLAKLGRPDDSHGEGFIMNAMNRAEAAMRALPPLPAGGYDSGGEEYPARGTRAAMSPTAGPDTGDVDPNAGPSAPGGYFKRLRGPESGGDPSIRNPTTGAGGLYQFLRPTWDSIRKAAPELGLTPEGFYDPSPAGQAQQERAVRHYTDESMRRLLPALKRQPTAGELYALHFLGHSGGMQLLQGLDKPVEEIVSPAAISANPWLKKYVGKPGRALLGRLEAMMG